MGSRAWQNEQAIIDYVYALPPSTTVVSGGAEGADTIATNAARARGMQTQIIVPDWYPNGKYDNGAGFRRNIQIVKAVDKVVAFHANNSKGTAHTIRIAKEHGKPVEVHTE